jgi:hypothetical protein
MGRKSLLPNETCNCFVGYLILFVWLNWEDTNSVEQLMCCRVSSPERIGSVSVGCIFRLIFVKDNSFKFGCRSGLKRKLHWRSGSIQLEPGAWLLPFCVGCLG